MRNERGFTLLELLVALMLIGIAVVPLLQLLPGTLVPAQVTDTDLRLSAAGARKTEELINQLRSDINGVGSGAQACADLPNCRLEWIIATEASSAVTNVGALKTIATVACQDSDANGACGPAEPQVRFDTKVTSRP